MWLFCTIVLLSLPQLVGGLAYAIEAGRVKQFHRFGEFKGLVIFWLLMSSICEITITLSITWTLRKHRQKKLVATEDIVKRIMRLTLQNGLVTTLWTITDLFTVILIDNGAHFMFCYPLAKLYINSFISTLNSRPVIVEGSMYDTSLMRISSADYTHLMTTHMREGSRNSSSMTYPQSTSAPFSGDDFGRMTSISLPISPQTRKFSTDTNHSHHHLHNESWDSEQPLLTEKLLPPTPEESA